MCKEIAAAYQTPWPATPIRVDVAAFAGPDGAYTTIEPTHITISSTDKGYQGDAALEMLYHESSHSLDEKVRTALENERVKQGLFFKRRGFSHGFSSTPPAKSRAASCPAARRMASAMGCSWTAGRKAFLCLKKTGSRTSRAALI